MNRRADAAFRVHAPGRVNLIGEHTDYTGGLVLPMAIDQGITLTATRRHDRVVLTSTALAGRADFGVPFTGTASSIEPAWAGYVAAMAAELGATAGIEGNITSTIPAGAGLSSSAALLCAVGLALGFEGTPLELAEHARRAEHAATGVPTGIMDQYCIAAATADHATLIDCSAGTTRQIALPDEVDVVVRFVAHRTLRGSPYRDRVDECARAEAEIGPLRSASPDEVASIADATVRRRARHVVTENDRVRAFVAALRGHDLHALGDLLRASHASLRDDYETSTPQMDAVVGELNATDGVFGARMTGGGFGGSVVAICRPGAITGGRVVTASAGARVLPPTG